MDSPSIKPSKIIEQHKTDDDTNDNKNDEKVVHDVKGRKGMDPGVDVVTEKSNNVDHVDDLNNLKIQTTTKAEVIKTTTLTTTTTTSTTSRSKGMIFCYIFFGRFYTSQTKIFGSALKPQ